MAWNFFSRKNNISNPSVQAAAPAASASPTPEPTQKRSYDIRPQGYLERDGDTWTFIKDANNHRLEGLLSGFYSACNYLNLFYCVPEVAAPVHEIASRVADAVYELRKEWNDEVDYSGPIYKHFEQLTTNPNPFMSFRDMVYMSVCYEILVGKQYFYKYSPTSIVDPLFTDVLTWWSWPAQCVTTIKRPQYDTYTSISLEDVVAYYEVPDPGTARRARYQPETVLPFLNLDLRSGVDVCRVKPLIAGAEAAIKNLIPVYEARGLIYIKRGSLGFWVSAKSDANGTVPLTPGEKEEAIEDFQQKYGVTGGRDPIGVTSIPLQFVKSAASIDELKPFDETEADAMVIYKVLRVPTHLVPSKNRSTYANADADMKAFYEDVIIPWAEKYAKAWTVFLGLDKERRYIKPNFSKVGVLQDNKKDEATTGRVNGQTMREAFLCGVITLNTWIVSRGETPSSDQRYNKRTGEMTPEELEWCKGFINMKTTTTNEQGAAAGNGSPANTGVAA